MTCLPALSATAAAAIAAAAGENEAEGSFFFPFHFFGSHSLRKELKMMTIKNFCGLRQPSVAPAVFFGCAVDSLFVLLTEVEGAYFTNSTGFMKKLG